MTTKKNHRLSLRVGSALREMPGKSAKRALQFAAAAAEASTEISTLEGKRFER